MEAQPIPHFPVFGPHFRLVSYHLRTAVGCLFVVGAAAPATVFALLFAPYSIV
jgi:hypothetical protein